MTTCIPTLIHHLETKPVLVHDHPDVKMFVPPELKMWDIVHEDLKLSPWYVWDSGEYEQADPKKQKKVFEEGSAWYRERFGREYAPRYQTDYDQIIATADDMAKMGLFRLPHRCIVIDDFYVNTPGVRTVIIAQEHNGHGKLSIEFNFFQINDFDGRFLVAWMPYHCFMVPEYDLKTMVVVPHAMFRDTEYCDDLLRRGDWHRPETNGLIETVQFAVKKFVVMLNSRGTIIERQTPVLTGREPKALRRLHRSYNTIRLPFAYEVNKDGERVEATGPKINRRAHWVRGHVRGRNCWPQHKWTWARPHFRGTGELYEPLFTEVVGALH